MKLSVADASLNQILACPAAMPMLRNQWYIAALANEVTEKPLARQICGDHIVFYRMENGDPVALADRCPHRGVPLSMGKIMGNNIQCPYHGFEFNDQGRCALVPSQSTINPQLQVRAYPLIEVGPYIWIWPGEAEADPALLPDQEAIGITRKGWRITPFFMMEFDCNYELLHENLLDTSHISFLHEGLIDSGKMAEAKVNVGYGDRSVKIWREVIEEPTPSMAAVFHLEAGKPVQRTLITEALAPNLSVITNIFTFPDQPDRPEHILITPQGVTPANDRKCLNFLVFASSYADEQPPQAIPALWHLFGQDQTVLNQVQKIFDEGGWDQPEVSVRADAAALNFRRKMARMVEQERAVCASPFESGKASSGIQTHSALAN